MKNLSLLIMFVSLLCACGTKRQDEQTGLKGEVDKQVKSISPTGSQKMESYSYQDVLELFESLNYTPQQWQAGIREIPRVYLMGIPQRWKDGASQMPVQEKKRIFFRLGAPLILVANERIQKERDVLLSTIKAGDIEGNEKLIAMARKYRVIKKDQSTVDDAALESLQRRVDIIPVSLALAQSAEESGWGSSRFAVLGNALFGQWDFSGNGIAVKQQRKELGNYTIASFDTPQDSVHAYMLNLNTNAAYRRLRSKRQELRKQGLAPSGWELAATLDKYSERGSSYVATIHQIMKYNHLQEADSAFLSDMEPIYLRPAQSH